MDGHNQLMELKLQVSLIFSSLSKNGVLFFLFPCLSLWLQHLNGKGLIYASILSLCVHLFSSTVHICFKVRIFLSHSKPHPWSRVSMTNLLHCSFLFIDKSQVSFLYLLFLVILSVSLSHTHTHTHTPKYIATIVEN